MLGGFDAQMVPPHNSDNTGDVSDDLIIGPEPNEARLRAMFQVNQIPGFVVHSQMVALLANAIDVNGVASHSFTILSCRKIDPLTNGRRR